MASPHFPTLALLLLLFLISTVVQSKTFKGDIKVLKHLKNSIDRNSVSPGSCISSWDFAADPCDALFSDRFICGFRCDVVAEGKSRVTELSLDQAGYSGELSSVSWNLPYLEVVDLSNNFFAGSLPQSLSNLTRLRRLGLSSNSFSGEIPDAIGSLSSLEELYLDGNQLRGLIPATFNGLVSLKRLELQSNNLAGEFPNLGSLTSLYYLDASNNAISGKLPTLFPASMVQISMRNNSLEGSIPDNFRNLQYLQVMDLSYNRLGDSVPSLLFEHPSLQQLSLSFNQFSSITPPTSIPTQSELIAVDISNNNLQGLLPPFMAAMPKLSALSLENNKFSGLIPILYALKIVVPGSGISQFQRLLLGGNYLFGPIPDLILDLKPGSTDLGLAGNCLYRCPRIFFFCQGNDQKSLAQCRSNGPIIP